MLQPTSRPVLSDLPEPRRKTCVEYEDCVLWHRTQIKKSRTSRPQHNCLAIDLVPVLAVAEHPAGLDFQSFVGLGVLDQDPFPGEPGFHFRTRQNIWHDPPHS